MSVKPGFKTTEFAITVLTDVGIVAAALAGNLTPRWAAIAAAVSTSAYALARGLAKQPAKAKDDRLRSSANSCSIRRQLFSPRARSGLANRSGSLGVWAQ